MNVPYITSALQVMNAALPAYVEAQEMYDGNAPEIHANIYIRKALRSTGEKFRVNWAKTAVDAVLNRLEISSITSPDDEATRIIEKAWKDNRLGLHARDIHKSALEFGDTYVIAWVGDEEGSVKIQHNEAKHVRMFYDSENPDVPTHAVKTWVNGDNHQRVTIYFPDRIERWVSTTPVTASVIPEDFEQYLDEDDTEWLIENPYGRVPIFHFRNEFPHGKPEHYSCYGPQHMLNKLVATQMAAVDFNTFPQRYALTEAGISQGRSDAEAEFEGDEDAPGLSDKPKGQDLVASPNGMWWMDPTVKSLGEFAAASPAVFIDSINEFVTAMAQVSDTPIHAYNLSGTPPTGESRRRAEAPLVQKVYNRQLTYGSTWKDLFDFVLVLAGYEVPVLVAADGTEVDSLNITWKSPEQQDDKDALETMNLKISMGIPKRTVFSEMGYSLDQIDAWGFTEANPNGSTQATLQAVTEPPVAA